MAQTRQLDEQAARFGQVVGKSGEDVKKSFDALEASTLTAAPVIANFSKSLGDITFDPKSSIAGVKALGDYALANGKSLMEGLNIGGTMMTALGVKEEGMTQEFDRIRGIAKDAGTLGGHLALTDSLTALRPQLQGVAADMDGTKHRTEALVAVLGKGLSAPEAQRAAGGVIGAIKGNASDIERALGHRVLDDNNRIIDPAKTTKELWNLALKANNGNLSATRHGLMKFYGNDEGLAIYRAGTSGDLNKIDDLANTKSAEGETKAEADKVRAQKESDRIARELALQQKLRNEVGAPTLGIMDRASQTLGTDGMAALLVAQMTGLPGRIGRWGAGKLAGGLSTTAGNVMGGLSTAVGVGEDVALGMGATALGGLGAMSAAFTGALALQLKTLTEVGEDRDSMGSRYRSEHPNIVAEGLVKKAMQEGDLTAAFVATKGDKPTQEALLVMLERLLASSEAGNDLLKDQVAKGIAAELHREPLKVQVPKPKTPPVQ